MVWKNFFFITKSNLNWYLKPSGEAVEAFYAADPDLLFDFTMDLPLELQFLVQLSTALPRDDHIAVIGVFEQSGDLQQGRFSRPGRPHKRDDFPSASPQADSVQHVLPFFVTEKNILKLNGKLGAAIRRR